MSKVFSGLLNKSINEITVLNAIRKFGPISRTEMTKITGLSGATVTKFVNNLLKTGLIREDGWESSQGGRKPVLLRISPDAGFIVGVDVGGENLRTVVIDLETNVITKVTKKTRAEEGKEKIFKRIVQTIHQVIDRSGIPSEKIKGIGIGISGLIDYKNGISLFCPNLPGWENVPVRSLIEKEFGLPVRVDDSSRAMALAENWCGIAQGTKNFIFVNVGIGSGCGIFTNGQIYRGTGGIAGEFGHITIDERGPRCNCGNNGCLETLASGPAIARRARKTIEEGVVSLIEKLTGGDLDRITPEIIVEAARKGDKLAFNIIEKTGKYLGIGIADMINIFNPELVVIGAGVSQAGDLLLDPVKRTVKARALQQSFSMVDIKLSQMGVIGGAIGAAILVLKNIFSLAIIED